MPLWAALLAARPPEWRCCWPFPPYGWWPLAPVGVALLAAAAHRRRLRAGAGLGLLTGLAFFAAAADLDEPARREPAVAAAVRFRSRLPGAAGRGDGVGVSPLVDRWRLGWPVLTGLLWVAQEALRRPDPVRRVPVGPAGVQPGRLAAAAAGRARRRAAGDLRGGAGRRAARASAAWAALRHRWRPLTGARGGGGRRGRRRAAGAGARRCWSPTTRDRRGRRGDGGDRAGQRAPAGAGLQRPTAGGARQPRRRHRSSWPRGSRAGQARRARTWWCGRRTPATSTRCATRTAAARISEAADAIGAPILVGAVLRRPRAGQVRNAGLVWRPGGRPGPRAAVHQAASGAVRRVHPAPRRRPAGQREGRPGPLRLRRRHRTGGGARPGRR